MRKQIHFFGVYPTTQGDPQFFMLVLAPTRINAEHYMQHLFEGKMFVSYGNRGLLDILNGLQQRTGARGQVTSIVEVDERGELVASHRFA